ncbi:unnamed protein product [Somion occarium]|uniref:Uncharacterized protein n=1 Tax=Somion occarium TaxID=3059160 RepID=A0ABP1CKR7_9APHY
MSAEVGSKPKMAPRSSSIKQFSSFLTGVMHSDSKEGEKEKKDVKKTKDSVSRRTSLAPRPSLDRQVGGKADKDITPENKTITKASRRLSGLPKPGHASSDEKSSSSAMSPKLTITRASSLRPKPRVSGSALPKPKYRPKSELIEPKKPPSPVRTGTRRRLSSSDDEGDDDNDKPKPPLLHLDISSLTDKRGRPISPMPHRNALKVNVTLNTRPVTPEMKASKIAKTSKTSATVPSRTTAPRPPSSTSSNGTARTPRTPKTPPSVRNIFGPSSGSNKANNVLTGSPLRTVAHASQLPDSPLGRISSAKKAQQSSPSPSPSPSSRSTPTPMIYTEGASMDSIDMDSMDANDVEFLLGEGVSPTKPTPAIPRLLRTLPPDEEDDEPHTPSRSTFLPARSQLSYLSPAPPTSESSPFLRPKARQIGNERGSILSWEQLALHNKSLGTEDIGHMLSDIPAPFRSGAISPALSSLPDIPESPTLSTLPSPTGYGSISQVLLPDVTPSPAPHNSHRFEQMAAGPEIAAADSAIVTLMRLQLASIENIAKERLMTIQSLENQLYSTKQASIRDVEELSTHVSVLEEQVRANLQAEEQRAAYTAQLEAQLADVRTSTEQAVSEAEQKACEEAAAARKAALDTQRLKWEFCSAAERHVQSWKTAKDDITAEVEHYIDTRETLDVLRQQLDSIYRQQELRLCSS